MKTIRHVGIVVNDMDVMLAFYRDLLKMHIAVDFTEKGDFIDTVIGLDGVDLRMVKLTAEDGSMIELLKYHSHPNVGEGVKKLYQKGPTHIAYTVEDVEETYAQWSKRGVPFISAPTLSPDGKAKVAFCRDPEGNFLEIVEEIKEQ